MESIMLAYQFIKEAGTYYLASLEHGEPRVRPFGTINLYHNKLYIQTGRKKDVYRQIVNQKVELCAFKNGEWLRLRGTLIDEFDVQAESDMMNHYPNLKSLYVAGDGNTAVLYFKDASFTIDSFTHERISYRF